MRKPATKTVLVALLLGAAVALRSQEIGTACARGRAALEAGNAPVAVEELRQAFRDDPGNPDVNVLLGQAAFAVGDFETAAAAFDRAVAMRPEWDRARLELARAYFHLGLHAVAEEHFLMVAGKPDTPETVRRRIEAYLDRIRAARREHDFRAALTVAAVRDDNARVSPDGTVTIPGLPGLDVPVARDWFWTQAATLEHRWAPRGGNWGWTSGLLGYHAFYDTEGDLDVTYVRLDTGPSWRWGTWSAGVAAHGAHMEKDHDRYLGTWGGRAWLAADLTDHASLRLECSGEERRYWQDPQADGFSITLALRPALGWGRHTLAADLGCEGHNAEEGYETYDRMFAGLTYQLALPWRLTMTGAYLYENWLFQRPEPLADSRRRDGVHQVSVGLRRAIGRHLAVELRHKLEMSRSSNDLYDYDRNVTSLSVTYGF